MNKTNTRITKVHLKHVLIEKDAENIKCNFCLRKWITIPSMARRTSRSPLHWFEPVDLFSLATGYFHQHHIYWQQVFFHTSLSYFHWFEKIIKINSPQIYTRIFYHKQHHFSLIQLHLSHTFFRF